MKKSKPDNVSNAFLEHQLEQRLVEFLRQIYAEGRAEGATPEEVSQHLMATLDRWIADQES
jgi:hypothetical protein